MSDQLPTVEALMAKQAKQFEKFPIDKIIDNSVTDFDLYVTVDNHFILYGGQGYRWNRDELTNLLSSGYKEFFVQGHDLPKAHMYEQLMKLPGIEKSQAPKERIQSIEQVGALFTKAMFEGEFTPACVEKGKVIANAIVDCVGEDPACIKELSGLAEHDWYTYYHSIRVATYACAIATKMGLGLSEDMRNVALGGIFHDIGKKQIPMSVLNKSGPLTQDEWTVMRLHPNLGQKTIKDSILGHIPQEIILHHHERLNGSGYPDKLDKNSILTEVQMATMADIFDALTSSRSYQNKRSRYEALDFIKHKLLGTELSIETFKALVACLV